MPTQHPTPADYTFGTHLEPNRPLPSARFRNKAEIRVRIFRILTIAALAMAALLALLPAVGHDQLWCLYVANQMLHGVPLYGPQILESNPPLIMWALLVPVSLANLLHLPATVLFKLSVLLIEAACAAVSLHLLRRLCPNLLRCTLWSLAFTFVAVFAVMPARDFGQRDHLLAILTLPYLIAAALDSRDTRHTRDVMETRGARDTVSSSPRTTPPRTSSPTPPLTPSSTQQPNPSNFTSNLTDQHNPSPSDQNASPSPTNLPSPDRRQGRPLSLSTATLIGISAGSGLALKPHQLLIPLAIELALLVRSHNPVLRSRSLHPHSLRTLHPLHRPEPWAILLTALTYLAAIRLVTPAYLTNILPILRDTYWAIGHLTLPQLIAESLQLHFLLAATVALLLANRRHPAATPSLRNLRRLANLLLLAGLAGTVAYYLQGTGWYYQQIPALSFTAFSLWLNLIDFTARHPLPTPAWLPKAATALAILAVALTAHFTGYPFTEACSFPITSPDPTFFQNLPPKTPIAILTTAVDDSIPPLFRYHLLWAQRTNNLWILPAILRNEDPQGRAPHPTIPPDRLAALDRDQHRFMVEDLTRWRPRLILVARCQEPAVHCQVLEDRHDNLLAWFSRDPAFRAVFRHYRYLRSSGIYDAYVLD